MKLTQGSGSDSNLFSRKSSLLDQIPSTSPVLTSSQTQVDDLVGGFIQQATDWRSLAAMMAGGMAYRFGRIGVMATEIRGSQILSVGLGLATEVTTFEITNRSLMSLTGDPSQNPNLWRWSGQGGVRQGLLSSLITFGTLKGAGRLAQGENVVVQHLLQDTGMVLGHQVSGAFGVTERPTGSLAEQFLHAEVTNLQLGAGTALGHTLTGGRLQALERGLDLSLQSQIPPTPLLQRGAKGDFAFAMAGISGNHGGGTEASSRRLSLSDDSTFRMKGSPGEGTLSSSTYSQILRERLAVLSSESVAETEQGLLREWERWEGKETLEASSQERIKNFLPHYARHALAHLGRETPAQLPFIPEPYEEALRSAPEIEMSPYDRAHLIRFLATQEGRSEVGLRTSETGTASLSLPGADFKTVRTLFGNIYDRWTEFLRVETDGLDLLPLHKAQIVQRGLNLFHFYGSYLFGKAGEAARSSNSKILFDEALIQRTLDDASRHPYPPETLALFERFFREVLQIDTSQAQGLRPKKTRTAESGALLSLQPLESEALVYEEPVLGENWTTYLLRLGMKRNTLLPDDWGLTGATVMKWGTLRDKKARLCPPGDILQLLGVITYLNQGGTKALDPFDVLRLTLPEQATHLRPNERGEIVLRFPDLMADLDYAHFGLPNLLHAYLRTVPEALDMDLGRQWGVSASTVKAYREGTTRKMHIENLQALAKSLFPGDATEAQRAEMENLLIFLRYRPYFDATMAIEDQDGTPLNHRPPQPSRFKIILAPTGEELRPLDLTRRLRFEREPFASAINGTVDLALSLLEKRAEEFRGLGYDQLKLTDQTLSLEAFSDRLRDYRDRHGEYFQRLSQQERSPGVVRPGELREIQDFYRSFFRLFEAVHLHARPQGEMHLGDVPIRFEVVPATLTQTEGARVLPDPENSTGLRVYAVASDLIEGTPPLSAQDQGKLLQARVMAAVLQHFGLWMHGPTDSLSNRRLLAGALRGNGLEISPELLNRFLTLPEGPAEAVALDPSTEAVLHRITCGHLSQGARERRVYRWENDLNLYIIRHRLPASLASAVREAFGAYAARVPHPFLKFVPERFEECLPAISPHGKEEIRRHLFQFMRGLGLPADPSPPAADSRVSAEGLAQAAFASYLHAFQSLHLLRGTSDRIPTGPLLADRALMERVVDDRLVDFSHLNPLRETVLTELAKRIEAYNARTPALRVHELARESEAGEEAWDFSLFDLSFGSVLQHFREQDSEIDGKISRPLIQASLRELGPKLAAGEKPNPAEIQDALSVALARLKAMGFEEIEVKLHHHFLDSLIERLYPRIAAMGRLSALLPSFVESHRIRSGLEGSPEIGAKVQEIFQRHLASSFLDARPLTLNETILQVIGSRFDPYFTIREDVLRGMRVLHRESLNHLSQRYGEMEGALEAAREEALEHRDAERFWEDFVALSSLDDPTLQDRKDVEVRISDLELFLGGFPFSPQGRLSRRLAEVAKEIEQLPKPDPITPEASPQRVAPDIASILAVSISSECLETYPELELVTEESLRQQIEGRHEGRDLAQPQARDLLQLLALLERYGQGLPEVELLILEARSSTEEEGLQEITERAYRNYEIVRENLLGQIDPLDRVGLLPELRMDGTRKTGLEVGGRLQRFLSLKILPPDLEKAFLARLDEVLQPAEASAALRSHDYDQVERIIIDPYFHRIADLYLRNRERVLEAPPLLVPEFFHYRILPTGWVPGSLRTKMEREAPEWDVVSDEQFLATLERDSAQVKGGEYLLEKLSQFLHHYPVPSDPNSPVAKALESLNSLFDRIQVLNMVGAECSPWNERVLAAYRRHRPILLPALIETVGIEKVMETLPELREEEVKPVMVPTEQGDILVARLDGFEMAAKAANRMLGLELTSQQKRNVEQVLWEFDPKEETYPKLASRIMKYYLYHREEFLDRPLRTPSQAWAHDLEEIFRPYWELNIVDTGAGEKATHHVENMIRLYKPALSQRILDAHKGDQRISMVVTEEDQDSMEEAWKKGKSFVVPGMEGRKIPKPDRYFFRPYDPQLQMSYVREILASTRFLTLYTYFLNDHAKDLMPAVDRELDRPTALLMLGVDEGRVIPGFAKRVLRLYEKGREQILEKMEFGPHVWRLPEVAGLPSHILDVQGGSTEYEPVELFTRLAALMNHLDEGAPDILGAWEREVGAGRGDPKKDVERSARFYLQHREEILPHLEPWEQASRPSGNAVENAIETEHSPEEALAKVKGLVEFETIKADSVTELLRLLSEPSAYPLPGLEGQEVLGKIGFLVCQNKDNSLMEEFVKEVLAQSPETREQMAAQFYLKYRRAINKVSTSDWQRLLHMSERYTELHGVDLSMLRKMREEAAERGTPFISLKDDLVYRINILISEKRIPRQLRKQFDDLVTTRVKGKRAFSDRILAFYQAHRGEILSARKK